MTAALGIIKGMFLLGLPALLLSAGLVFFGIKVNQMIDGKK